MKKSLKCKLGLHKYVIIGSQQTTEIDSISGIHFGRTVRKCTDCDKINYENNSGIAFGNQYKDESLNWLPKNI
jgi:hypothetical protein